MASEPSSLLQECILDLLRAKDHPQEFLALAQRLRPSLAAALGQREDSFGLEDAQEYLIALCRDVGLDLPSARPMDKDTTTEGLLSPNTEEQLRLSLDSWSRVARGGEAAAAARHPADSIDFAPAPEPESARTAREESPVEPPSKRLATSPVRRTDVHGNPIGPSVASPQRAPPPALRGRDIRIAPSSVVAVVPEILDVASIPPAAAEIAALEDAAFEEPAPQHPPPAAPQPEARGSLDAFVFSDLMPRPEEPPAARSVHPVPTPRSSNPASADASYLEDAAGSLDETADVAEVFYRPPPQPRVQGQQERSGFSRQIYVAPPTPRPPPESLRDAVEEPTVALPRASHAAVQATLQTIAAGTKSYLEGRAAGPSAADYRAAAAAALAPYTRPPPAFAPPPLSPPPPPPSGLIPADLYPNLAQQAQLQQPVAPPLQVNPRPKVQLEPAVQQVVDRTVSSLKQTKGPTDR